MRRLADLYFPGSGSPKENEKEGVPRIKKSAWTLPPGPPPPSPTLFEVGDKLKHPLSLSLSLLSGSQSLREDVVLN